MRSMSELIEKYIAMMNSNPLSSVNSVTEDKETGYIVVELMNGKVYNLRPKKFIETVHLLEHVLEGTPMPEKYWD